MFSVFKNVFAEKPFFEVQFLFLFNINIYPKYIRSSVIDRNEKYHQLGGQIGW